MGFSGRVGIGFDVHKFVQPSSTQARTLMLGGVAYPNHLALDGHSDADVVAHAICDALLGAAGLGDMGAHFPDTDETWRNVSGVSFLTATKGLVRNGGWRVENVDCTVIAESPKVASHRTEMEQRLSEAIDAPVNVKAVEPKGWVRWVG